VRRYSSEIARRAAHASKLCSTIAELRAARRDR
jgi:hypothetical protein